MPNKNLRLFHSIALLSDDKSFSINVWNAFESLWILRHFNHLKITFRKIFYKQSGTIWTRKSTDYPQKELRKKFHNTSELLDYLGSKYYDIEYLEIIFENGFRILIRNNNTIMFCTDSMKVRNKLIFKIVELEGYKNFPINKLTINVVYTFIKNNSLSDYGFGASPDEFWSEEQWSIWMEEKRKLECIGITGPIKDANIIKMEK